MTIISGAGRPSGPKTGKEESETTPLVDCQKHGSASLVSTNSSSSDSSGPSSSDSSGPFSSDSSGPSSSDFSESSSSGDKSALFSHRQRLLLLCLSAGNLLAGCCEAIMLPFFPHEAQRRGLPRSASGAVFSCYALSQLLAFPLTGWLVPRVGVGRLYQAGLTTAGAANVAFGLLVYVRHPGAFLGGCLGVRAVEAVGTAAMQTAANTIVINQFQRRRNVALSTLETTIGAGLVLGPAIGGPMYALGGYGAPFYTLGVLMVVAAAGNRWSVRDVGDAAPESAQPRQAYGRMALSFVGSFDNWLCCTVILATAMNWTTMDPNMEPYVRRTLGLTPPQLGLFFLWSFALYSLSSPLWGCVADAVDNTFLLVAGCLAVGTVGVVLMPPAPLLGLSPTWWSLALGMALRELFQLGAYMPLLGFLERLNVRRGLEDSLAGQAFVSAAFGTAYALGNVAGPVTGGIITDYFGFPTIAFFLGGFGAAVCATAAVRGAVYQRQLSRERRQATEKPEAAAAARATCVP